MGPDRGSAGVGLAIGGLCLVILLQFAVGALRLITVNGQVSAASRSAARAAANAYGPDSGVSSAAAIAEQALGGGRSACGSVGVEVEGQWRPDGRVTVAVTCTVDLTEVGLAGFAPSAGVRHSAAEVIDRYRGAGP